MIIATLECGHKRVIGDGHHEGDLMDCMAREHGDRAIAAIQAISASDDSPIIAAARERARLQLETDLAGAALDRARANLRDATKRAADAQLAYSTAQLAVEDAPKTERTAEQIREWVAARIDMYDDNVQHMHTVGGQAGMIEASKVLRKVLAFIDGEDL